MPRTATGKPAPGEIYRPGPGWDEACAADGSPREHYDHVLDALAGSDLRALSREVAEHLRGQGASFGGGDGSAFRVDPVPRIVAGSEWARVEAGMAQRARALAAFAADVYGERRIVDAGLVPLRAIESAGHYEPDMVGVEPAGAGYVVGLDLVRGADGVLRVLEDNIRTPSGIAYTIAARAAVDAHLPASVPTSRADPGAAYLPLAAMVQAAAPAGVDEPLAVLLSDGPHNSAWWEHGQAAQALGVPLVGPRTLSVRAGRLQAELNGHARTVDVVYRRTDEDRLRDAQGRPTWIAELLLEPVRAGTLAVVNPLGCGVADDKLLHAYAETMVRFYLDEKPLIESVPTYDLGEPETRRTALARLDGLVVKPRSGLGGEGIVIGPHASSEALREIAERVTARPDDWIAQDLVSLSTHPTVCDGRLEPRHVDLRPFAIGDPDRMQVVPGALTRVAFDRGNIVVNSSQHGGGKDTWVIA